MLEQIIKQAMCNDPEDSAVIAKSQHGFLVRKKKFSPLSLTR